MSKHAITGARRRVLVKIMEEAGEIVQAASKMIIHGKTHSNFDNLNDECGDLLSLLEHAEELGLVNHRDMAERVAAKTDIHAKLIKG